MQHEVPRLAPDGGLSPRRRLVVAIGGTLVLGVIAATIAREHEAEQGDASGSSPAFDLSSLSSAIRTPSPARAEPKSETGAAATEALRVRVDRYLDARAAALRQLDTARRQGVDPAVISAMAAVLGMPAERPSGDASTASTREDAGREAPRLAADDDEPRAL